MDDFNPFDFLRNKGLFNPFYSLEKLQQTPWVENYVNKLLGPDFWGQIIGNDQDDFKKVEVFETSDEVIVLAEVPGLEKENDVRIILNNLTLSLEATTPVKKTEFQPENSVFYNNTNHQPNRKFSRKIVLPHQVKSFGAKAIYKNGILEIKLPKEILTDESHVDVQFL